MEGLNALLRSVASAQGWVVGTGKVFLSRVAVIRHTFFKSPSSVENAFKECDLEQVSLYNLDEMR